MKDLCGKCSPMLFLRVPVLPMWLTVATACGLAPAQEAMDVREDVERVARDVARADPERRRQMTWEIARRHGREAVDPLLDLLLRTDFGSPGDRFAVETLVEICDPDASRLRSERATDGVNRVGLAVVAAAWAEDDQSRETLLRLARDEGPATFRSAGACLYAAGLLRSQGSDAVRDAVRNALKDKRPRVQRVLRALSASAEYRSSLPKEELRAAYGNFERRLWRTLALARTDSHRAGREYEAAAAEFARRFKPGDERFVLRILRTTDTTDEEVSFSVALVAGGYVDGIQGELAGIPDDNPHAAKVRQALRGLKERPRARSYPR